MKAILKLFLSFVFLFVFLRTVSASEGTFELRSTDGNDYKCFAASLRMQNGVYKVILSCRNIIFPVDETIFSYILWANPETGGTPVKVGSVGLGKGEYGVKTSFASLFVTTEQNPNVKTPEGKVVMKGSIKTIRFLEEDVTNDNGNGEDDEDGNDEEKSDTEEPTQAPEQEKSSIRDRLLTGLKRAGLASALALVAILGLVFVLTRPK